MERTPLINQDNIPLLKLKNATRDISKLSRLERQARVDADDNIERYYGQSGGYRQRHGQGTYYFANGDYYIGNWRKGRMEGRGEYVYASGRRNIGWFYKNNYQGQEPSLKLRWKRRRGLIPNTSPSNSSGTRDDGRDERYVGNYKGRIPHGEGSYFYPDGSFYKGNWRKGRKEGKGRVVYPNGDEVTGWFYRNDYVGERPNQKLRRKIRRGMIPDPGAGTSNWREASVSDSDSDLDNLGGAAGFAEIDRRLADQQAEIHG